MYTRPDRPLVVKCTFERSSRRITFSSTKVNKCFSLDRQSYSITYTDDDGEVNDISSETELSEAIKYFQDGTDDASVSSASSRLSIRSLGSKKITLRVTISVDYDGRLSDTSSLVSMEDYQNRNNSQSSFSFGAPTEEIDDDSVTVSSRDTSAIPPSRLSDPFQPYEESGSASPGSPATAFLPRPSGAHQPPTASGSKQQHLPAVAPELGNGQSRDELDRMAAGIRYPEDPSAVFERLKYEELIGSDTSSVDFDALNRDDRGAAWLRDQNERIVRSKLGALPEPSESDDASLSLDGSSLSLDADELADQLDGDLALQMDPRGKYYYSYTSSQPQDSLYDDHTGLSYDGDPSIDSNSILDKPRPTSMQLDWLAAHQVEPQPDPGPSRRPRSPDPFTVRDLHRSTEVTPGMLRYFPTSPPSDEITDCSSCGLLLDAIRYVCSTCGPKPPRNSPLKSTPQKIPFPAPNGDPGMTYPPSSPSGRSYSSSPAYSSSSRTLIADFEQHAPKAHAKPLPLLPSVSVSTSGSSSSSSSNTPWGEGYELCSGCIESAGHHHAVSGLRTDAESPRSPEDAQYLRRSAPKQKGQLRHAYQEKIWGHLGWDDVGKSISLMICVLSDVGLEQDESKTSKCTFCSAPTLRKSYKCASCTDINVCKACYSQIHDLHPLHAFLVVPDKRVRSPSDPEPLPTIPVDLEDEESMKHADVKCAHCLLDIVGARFHCAICEDSVDICSNCESAGLPGNLDSSDGGHNSSHIMIKIPYPLESSEVKTASRRAAHLWLGRDAANVGYSSSTDLKSSYAKTVVNGGDHPLDLSPDDHDTLCRGCNEPIIGIRYQCASCPSRPAAYSLCAHCEERSYELHNPYHAFFKLPRPVDRPISSEHPVIPPLYKAPVGKDQSDNFDPKAYLETVQHASALCDCCVTQIQGEWFRCAYCGRDLCDTCQLIDTHDDTHVFLVFKAPVDMRQFRQFADPENPRGSRPMIHHPVYNQTLL
ncbi:hypothetical protein HGRIS_004607 [Hohenbuehelia grisea]|uniref:ZZ-type domain-containing protein n=1 Tax=Hohenbuehelia grisea TaxID=104357 RepID=A0ABR3JD07_9AGAR